MIGAAAATIAGFLSLANRLLKCLFGLPSALVRSDLSKDVELLMLRHEDQVHRRELGGRPPWFMTFMSSVTQN